MVAAGGEDAVRIIAVARLILVECGRNLVQPRDPQTYPSDQCKCDKGSAQLLHWVAAKLGARPL
jgi:hypothetical protein